MMEVCVPSCPGLSLPTGNWYRVTQGRSQKC